jgi:subtilisin family serine protease
MKQLSGLLTATLVFIILTVLLTVHQPSSAGKPSGVFIRLKAEEFDPLQHGKRSAETGETRYLLVQTTGPVLPEWKSALENLGCEIIWYIPDYSFLVRVGERFSQTDIGKLPFVRWVGPYLPEHRLHPVLRGSGGLVAVRMLVAGSCENVILRMEDLGIRAVPLPDGRVEAVLAADSLINVLSAVDDILWVEPRSQPILLNENARWVIQSGVYHLAPVHDNGLRGENQLVTIADTGIRLTHEMFVHPGENVGINHRKIQAHYVPDGSPGTLGDESGHGTHVAGSVAGDAGTWFAYDVAKHDGQAFAARIIVQDIDNDSDPYIYPPDDLFNLFQPAYDVGSLIHTNSWGDYGDYSTESQMIDNFLWLNKDFTILFAAGNAGPNPGTITSQSQSKNAIAVGATRNGTLADNIPSWSSRGPTTDNRIRPTLVAPGSLIWSADYSGDSQYTQKSGTSMATPTVAGAAALVRQYYEEGWYPSGRKNPADSFEPSGALVKATLIAGAVEISGSGAYQNGYFYPNWDQGWGRVNLGNSLYFEGGSRRLWVVDNRVGISTGQTATYFIQISDNAQQLKFVLSWTDYPGSPSASVQLVNDLDLKVTEPNGNVYWGNVFAGYNPGFSVTGGSPDNRNTEEAVILVPENNAFPAGTYRVDVIGRNIPMGEPGTDAQPFALVVCGGICPGQPVVLPKFTWTQTDWEGGPKSLEAGRFPRSYAWFASSENISHSTPGMLFLSGSSGYLDSSIFDAGCVVDWKEVRWKENRPPGTSITVKLRTGFDNNPYDGGWSDWFVHTNGSENSRMPNGRYLQYRIELSKTNPLRDPSVFEITVVYERTVLTLPRPEISRPLAGENTGENSPLLTWSQVSSDHPPVVYRIWIDNDPDFSSVDRDSGWIENASWVIAPPLPDGIWHVRVQAKDSAGYMSENSESWFRVDTVPPGAPSQISPADGENTNDNTPTFIWVDVFENSLPVLYYVTVSDNSEFPQENATSGWIAENSWTAPALRDGLWYWRVKARDNAGNEGAWSAAWCFRVDTTPPATPVKLSPENGRRTKQYILSLAWQRSEDPAQGSGVLRYEVWLSNQPDFSQVIVLENVTGETYETPPLVNGTYYWRVRAWDASGNASSFEEPWSFTVDTVSPPVPAPSSPSNGSLLNSNSPLLSWSPVSKDSLQILYRVRVSPSPGFAGAMDSGWIPQTSWRPEPLADGTYYWKVMARDEIGNESGWSMTRSFTIDTTPPTSPSPLSPSDGQAVGSQSVTLVWSQVDDVSQPVAYTVSVSSSPDFSLDLRSSGWISSTSFSLTLPEGTWFWRVMAKDAAGNASQWSSVRSFVLDISPPETPKVFSPTHQENLPASRPLAIFTWSRVGGPSPVTYSFRLEPIENEWRSTSDNSVTYDNLPDGLHIFRLFASEAGGRSNEASYRIVVDTTSPGLETGHPENTPITSPSRRFLLRGRTEPSSVVEAGNVLTMADENGFFSLELDLSGGTNTIHLRITDRAGNSSEHVLTVVLSEETPIWPLLLPASAVAAFLILRFLCPARGVRRKPRHRRRRYR